METILSLERVQGLISTAPESILRSFTTEFTTILGGDTYIYLIQMAMETDSRADFETGFEKYWRIPCFVRNAVGEEMIKDLVEEEWDFTERPIALLESLLKQKKDSSREAYATRKTLEAFASVLQISHLEHKCSVSQMTIQLRTKQSIARTCGMRLEERELQKIRESMNKTQAMALDSLSARSIATREAHKALELSSRLRREARLVEERCKA
jgi:hypothetical protein